MATTEEGDGGWREWLSPMKLGLLAVNGVSFGGLLVLLAFGVGGGPVVVLTIGTGVSFAALVVGTIIAAGRTIHRKSPP